MDARLTQAEAIVFDVGNVLLSFDPAAVCGLLPENLRESLPEWLFGAPFMWAPFDQGLESNEALAQKVEDASGLPGAKDAVLYLLRHFPETMHPLPLYGCLDALSAMGKRLYALTNYCEPSFTITCERFPLLKDRLLGAVVSHREKLVKPDPAFFRLLRDRYHLIPEKTLFIDDVRANVDAAAREGFRIWHYAGEDRLPPHESYV